MTDEIPRPLASASLRQEPPAHRWVHFKGACEYLDLSPVTLAAKLNAGVGPKFYRSPGSRNRIFRTDHLDDWVANAPERPLTEAECDRLIKLQAGARRSREQRRRERQQAEIDEDVSA
jgi:hypothetical protein